MQLLNIKRDSRQVEAKEVLFIMALYKYFKPSKPSETLATEQNNLSKTENEKVIDELRSVEENKGKRQKYRIWTPTQRAEIGKHAAEHGNGSIVRAMGLKYPGLKRQTVSDLPETEKR